MKRNVFIFHGTAGSPEGNWFPWLKEKLEALEHQVFVPRFPTPEGESLQSWYKVLEGYADKIDGDAVLIGHSKGGMFCLRVLESLEKPVHAAFIVSAPIGIKPIRYYSEDLKFADSFTFDWEKIKVNAKTFFVYHSDNDPYVSLNNGKELSKILGVGLQFIPSAGHLNAESGYTKFEKLLEDVKSVL